MREHRLYQLARFWEIRMPLIIIAAIICFVTYTVCVYPHVVEKPRYPYYEGR